MSDEKAVYDAEMIDKTTGESLGTAPVSGELETAAEAQTGANEIADGLSELLGDEITAGEVFAE